jgi:HPt (histidine-containing phosphotransfer) domain-containing protein
VEQLAVLSSEARRSAKLVGLFLKQAPIELANLEAALHAGDGDGVRGVSHKLKGSCYAIGALRMAAMCEGVEKAAPPDVSHHTRLVEEFEHVRVLLEGELGAASR